MMNSYIFFKPFSKCNYFSQLDLVPLQNDGTFEMNRTVILELQEQGLGSTLLK